MIPAPDVDEVMVPLPMIPWTSGPPVTVTVYVPPRGGSGHVSPEVTVVGDPFVVIVELIPVARPLYS